MKTIDSIWFTNYSLFCFLDISEMALEEENNPTIGVVLGYDRITDKFSAYIGIGLGFDEKEDVKRILHYGSRLSYQQARGFFPLTENLNEKRYKQT